MTGLLLPIYLILVALWIFVAYRCAQVAIRKGRSPVPWAILGVLFPLIALIVVYLLPPTGAARVIE